MIGRMLGEALFGRLTQRQTENALIAQRQYMAMLKAQHECDPRIGLFSWSERLAFAEQERIRQLTPEIMRVKLEDLGSRIDAAMAHVPK